MILDQVTLRLMPSVSGKDRTHKRISTDVVSSFDIVNLSDCYAFHDMFIQSPEQIIMVLGLN